MTETDTYTTADYVHDHGITLVVTRRHGKVEDPWPSYRFTVQLVHPSGRTLETQFSHGLGYNPDDIPAAADVFDCLVSDADAIDFDTFEDWAREYGYDTDSRKAERDYHACRKTADQLLTFLGGAVKLQEVRGLERM
jgi:hypothetical protein